ncbi:MAG TPA: helix-turn-helix transcriptional regulator [Acidimicrobiales bacterium]|nr:helix-turn-helix transcriptional regulator [Acidimicrobiales bacterium]
MNHRVKVKNMALIRLTPQERLAFGQRMRAARELAGLSMTKVADETGVAINAVTQWEKTGATPGIALRPVLAELYGVEEDLLFREYAAHMAANRKLLSA